MAPAKHCRTGQTHSMKKFDVSYEPIGGPVTVFEGAPFQQRGGPAHTTSMTVSMSSGKGPFDVFDPR